jgi:uncharacterized repeat protein (TIGR01451 family)
MKSSLCLIKKQTACFGIVGLMLAIASLGLMLALANQSAQAQAPANVSSATTSPAPLPSNWAQFHADNMQRWNPNETVLGVGNVGSLKLKWKSPDTTKGIMEAPPAVVNGVVYFGSSGNVFALNASTGAVLWNFVAAGQVSTSAPAVANGVVYIGSENGFGGVGNMYALSASTGAKLWSFTTGSPMFSSPTVANGVVYITSFDGSAYALNAVTGAKLWSFDTGGRLFNFPAPIAANGVAYFQGGDGKLHALNASTGTELWSSAVGIGALANGVVYVGCSSGVCALNARTGAMLWSFAIGGSLDCSAVANGVVYVTSEDENVYALNASTGAKLWSAFVGDNFETSPAVANGVVYIGSDVGGVSALDASTGATLFSIDLGNDFQDPNDLAITVPTVANGVMYIYGGVDANFNGNIYAFSVGADLFLRAQPSATTVHQGDLLTYTFPVWNQGPDIAAREVLNTQVPAGTTFNYIRISGTPGLGTCATPKYLGTGQIICHENASMAPNTTWTVRLTVRVTAAPGTVITESAATLADTLDPNPANNTATVSIKVQ